MFFLLRYGLMLILLSVGFAGAQDSTNVQRLREMAEQFRLRYEQQKAAAVAKALEMGWPIWKEYEDGTIIEIQRLDLNDIPIYYITDNLNAAKTVSTDDVWPGGSTGLNLTGSGFTIGEWDGGAVLTTHQEYNGRVTRMDSYSTLSNHSTHVAGTMVASGVVASAKGMAGSASLHTYYWDNDESAMATAAGNGLMLSNHSYGISCGWDPYGFSWYGNASINANEDYKFGYYTEGESKAWDEIAYNAPYYLICKSAGNDRGHIPLSGEPPERDGGADGYDCIGPQGVAKNILTIGAVEDIPNGYNTVSDVVMTSFSSWGPTDDGRIKPDLVANGVGVYSCDDDNNADYTTMDGTSMATPNTTGSLALLAQQWRNLAGSYMRAATLKALAIHTADEAGSANGPDYRFGWGLLNTSKAAQLIAAVWVSQNNQTVKDIVLNNSESYSFQITSNGAQPLRVTVCWTDPAGTPHTPLTLDPPDIMLVNDLDLRLTRSGTTYYPWTFTNPSPNNPSTTATTGDNIRDNVEQVYIASPASGTYTITVNHKGTLQGGSQRFSLIMSGAHYSDQSLPVKLNSLTASAIDNHVRLVWETQSELDNQGFNVLRSGIENAPFTQIASYKTNRHLKGMGTSSFGREYSFEDYDVKAGETYWYQIEDESINGVKSLHGPISVTYQEQAQAPGELILSGNYPNPFNPSTSFVITVPANNGINNFGVVKIYDLLGRNIRTLYEGQLEAGEHRYNWDGKNNQGIDLPTGAYVYAVSIGNYSSARQMLLIR